MILFGPVGGDGNTVIRQLRFPFPDDMSTLEQRLDVQGIIGGGDRGEDGALMHEIVHRGFDGGRVATDQVLFIFRSASQRVKFHKALY